jgi:hypothetical protein
MPFFFFGVDPNDFTLGQPLDEPDAVQKLAGFLFNPKPRCCTFHVHGTNKYFILSGVRSRSVGFWSSSCSATVRKWFFRPKRVYSCKCSVSVLGDKAKPFTEAEWAAFHINSLGRSVIIGSCMEGGQDAGKN